MSASVCFHITAGQELFEPGPDLIVAFACGVFEPGAIYHLDAAPMLLNQAQGLDATQNAGDRRTLDTEHFGEDFVSQGQCVLIQPVMRAENPPAAPRLDRMNGVAGDRMIGLGEQSLIVRQDLTLDGCACLKSIMHALKGEAGSAAGYMHDIAPEGFPAYEGAEKAEQPFSPEHCYFRQVTISHDIDQRDDGIMRKICVADRIPSLINNGATWQDHCFEMGLQNCKILCTQRGQKPVGPVIWRYSRSPGEGAARF